MKIWISLCFLVMLVLVGCGGSGGGSSTKQEVERFQGTYGGTWTSNNSQNGTSAIAIAPNGSFSGSIHNNTFNLDGSIEGQITGDGSFEGSIAIDNNVFEGNGTFNLSPDLETMTGTLVDGSLVFTFTFTRQPI